MSDLPLLTIYPAQRNLIVLRNSTYRKRWILKIDDVEVDTTTVQFDADIHDNAGLEIGSFDFAFPESSPGVRIPGMFDMQLSPAQSLTLPTGTWSWDLNATFVSGPNSGDRFYYVTGTVQVQNTVSREP